MIAAGRRPPVVARLARPLLNALAVCLLGPAVAAVVAGDGLMGAALAVAAVPLLAIRDRCATPEVR